MSTFDLGGQGGNSFPFENIGDSITGQILDLEEVQQTDMDTGEPVEWPNGKPKMMFRLTLQTDLRDPADPADDGVRSIYLRGSRKSATRSSLAAALDAVKRATGNTQMQTGATYTHTYVADGVPSRRGYNAPKEYEGHYVPPAMNLDGDQAAAPAMPQQAPHATHTTQAQAPAQQAAAPAPAQQAPAQAAPQAAQAAPAGKYTAEQLAALQAAGIDPATLPA